MYANDPNPTAIFAMLVAALVAGGAGLSFGRVVLCLLAARYRERVKTISPTVAQLHRHKANTPTLGGVLIVLALVCGAAAALVAPSPPTILAVASLVLFALLGAIDDLVKLRTERRGLTMRGKLIGQLLLASGVVLIAWWLGFHPEPCASLLGLSFSATTAMGLSLVAGIVLIAGSANAVNLTDGLDGLAAGCGVITSLALAGGLLLVGQPQLAVLAAALAASLAAFLCFNRHPAQVFMGDTGSQAVGALLGYLAWVGNCPWFYAVVAAVFVAELISVVLQLGSYRVRGQRLFRCAPLHHHFQFGGWSEIKIVRRFWVAAALCAACGMLAITFNNTTTADAARSKRADAVQPTMSVRIAGPMDLSS